MFAANTTCVFELMLLRGSSGSNHIKYVIGMNSSVPDELAIRFAEEFYSAISAGTNMEVAFLYARTMLQVHSISGDDIPVLFIDGIKQEAFRKQIPVKNIR